MTHAQYEKARAAIDVADDIFGDLPDGAYWAACDEQGVGVYVQLEVDEYEQQHKLGAHSDV